MTAFQFSSSKFFYKPFFTFADPKNEHFSSLVRCAPYIIRIFYGTKKSTKAYDNWSSTEINWILLSNFLQLVGITRACRIFFENEWLKVKILDLFPRIVSFVNKLKGVLIRIHAKNENIENAPCFFPLFHFSKIQKTLLTLLLK